MDGADDGQDCEEMNDVDKRLGQKGVQLDGSVPDRSPVRDEDGDGEKKKDRGDRDGGRSPDPPDILHGTVQKAVRIKDLEEQEKRVESFGALLGRPFPRVLELLDQSEMPS